MTLRVGQRVRVRLPSMMPNGYEDRVGYVSEVLPGGLYNVTRESLRRSPPVAYGQPLVDDDHPYGIIDDGYELVKRGELGMVVDVDTPDGAPRGAAQDCEDRA